MRKVQNNHEMQICKPTAFLVIARAQEFAWSLTIERFSIECHKTKNKVITQPITTASKNISANHERN